MWWVCMFGCIVKLKNHQILDAMLIQVVYMLDIFVHQNASSVKHTLFIAVYMKAAHIVHTYLYEQQL